MEKLIFSLMAVATISIISCQKENQNPVVDAIQQTTEDVSDVVDQTNDMLNQNAEAAGKAIIDIPQFSNPDVQKFADEYGNYITKLLDATTSQEKDKIDELMQQGLEYTKKANELAKTMTPEDKQKWEEWNNKLRSLVN